MMKHQLTKKLTQNRNLLCKHEKSNTTHNFRALYFQLYVFTYDLSTTLKSQMHLNRI